MRNRLIKQGRENAVAIMDENAITVVIRRDKPEEYGQVTEQRNDRFDTFHDGQ
jgi:hypothetical protein